MSDLLTAETHEELDGITIFLHAGLMVLGVLAWLTGDWAGDYRLTPHWGFAIHKHLGIGLAFFLLLRIGYGFVGPTNAKFAAWVPYSKERLTAVWEDILTLAKLKLPDRPARQGLAGLAEFFGLAVFTWMAATGTYIYYCLKPGHWSGVTVHFVKELHEAGAALIPVFLVIHIGAVMLHALAGDHRWRKMFFLSE
jgi:cytochrome b